MLLYKHTRGALWVVYTVGTLISSQSIDVISLLIWIHHMDKNVSILHQKPADLDLHYFQTKAIEF